MAYHNIFFKYWESLKLKFSKILIFHLKLELCHGQCYQLFSLDVVGSLFFFLRKCLPNTKSE